MKEIPYRNKTSFIKWFFWLKIYLFSGEKKEGGQLYKRHIIKAPVFDRLFWLHFQGYLKEKFLFHFSYQPEFPLTGGVSEKFENIDTALKELAFINVFFVSVFDCINKWKSQ